MKAGPELDALIAHHVMGCDYVGFDTGVPKYSTHESDAQMVERKVGITGLPPLETCLAALKAVGYTEEL